MGLDKTLARIVKLNRQRNSLYAKWRDANKALSPDRNLFAGKIYEATSNLTDAVGEIEAQAYADGWVDRVLSYNAR